MSDFRVTSKRSVALVASVALGSFGLAATPAMAAGKTIEIVSITDFHGHIETAPALTSILKGIEKNNPNTLFVSNGDNIGGSAYISSIAKDEPTIKILNAMGLDVSSVGNHEFDAGYDDLKGRVLGLADFDYLGANVAGAKEINTPEFKIIEKDGVKVAFIGTVTSETPDIVSKSGVAGLTFGDPVAKTNEIAAKLKDGNDSNGEADVVVSLIHEGSEVAKTMGKDVDVVLSGHAHGKVEGTTAGGGLLLEAGSLGAAYGHVSITVDGDKVSATGKVVEFEAPEFENDADKEKAIAAGTIDAEIQKMLDEAQANADKLGSEKIGTTEGAWRGKNTDASENRGTESSLGNILANTALATANAFEMGADFGIINPGGVRADLSVDEDKDITYGEAYTVQPFGNTIGTIDLTGDQVFTMLEQQFQDGQSRPMLRLGLSDNVTYTFDPAAEQGSRITGVYLDGKAIDRSATYTIASNTFLITGQDGFTVFEQGKNSKETGYVDLNGFIDYIKANSPITVPAGQRSIGVTLPEGGLQAGATATIELSSLTFTASEKKPVKVTLLAGGKEIGSADIDSSKISDGLDTTGTASVKAAIPAGFDGNLQIKTTFADGSVDTDVTVSFGKAPKVVVDESGAYIDLDGNGKTDNYFKVGRAGDEVFVGDWDGNGTDTLGLRRGNTFFVFNTLRPGNADASFTFGKAGDTVLVGDYDGDGKDTFAVRRGNVIYVDNALTGGNAKIQFAYGKAGDKAFAGDFDGDGKDTFAVRRGQVMYVDNTLEGGNAEIEFAYGKAGDTVLVGDFNGDKIDTLSVRRGNINYITNSFEGGNAERAYSFGRVTDEVLVGDWDGNGTDTVSIFRR